ncbi:nitroreductase family protein [Enterococcus faecalis]|nr:nitroreductase family protein [Enterococcus faecalis]
MIIDIAGVNKDGLNLLYGAKTLIVISAPENSFHAEQFDVGIMAQTILLEATDLGLNSIVMTSIIPALKEERIISTLTLPNGYIPFIGVALGNTDE